MINIKFILKQWKILLIFSTAIIITILCLLINQDVIDIKLLILNYQSSSSLSSVNICQEGLLDYALRITKSPGCYNNSTNAYINNTNKSNNCLILDIHSTIYPKHKLYANINHYYKDYFSPYANYILACYSTGIDYCDIIGYGNNTKFIYNSSDSQNVVFVKAFLNELCYTHTHKHTYTHPTTTTTTTLTTTSAHILTHATPSPHCSIHSTDQCNIRIERRNRKDMNIVLPSTSSSSTHIKHTSTSNIRDHSVIVPSLPRPTTATGAGAALLLLRMIRRGTFDLLHIPYNDYNNNTTTTTTTTTASSTTSTANNTTTNTHYKRNILIYTRQDTSTSRRILLNPTEVVAELHSLLGVEEYNYIIIHSLTNLTLYKRILLFSTIHIVIAPHG